MKFTPEEISLCRQVAREYRRFPKKGDWEHSDSTKEITLRTRGYMGISPPQEVNVFLLWTVSDCLEFLREKGLTFSFYHYDVEKYFFECGYVNKRPWSDIVAYKTPLEACLKAVLAVLEDEEK